MLMSAQKKRSLKKILSNSNHFYCISHYNGNLNWIKYIKDNNYLVYNKSNNFLGDDIKKKNIKNVGYNISSYLDYIINNYNNLPKTVVFCKDNIFERHISIDRFLELLKNEKFTSLEENIMQNNQFPINVVFSDLGFAEINNSWYKLNFPRKYFSNFNEFFNFIFETSKKPQFISFSPGANYIVPKINILSRSKEFYINLLSFISHSRLSCESHFLERSLKGIWDTNNKSSFKMDKILSEKELSILSESCFRNIKKESNLNFTIKKKLLRITSFYFSFIFRYILSD